MGDDGKTGQTPEQIKQLIQDSVKDTVTAAITSAIETLSKQFLTATSAKELVSGAVGEQLQGLNVGEMIKTAITEAMPKTPEAGEDPNGGKGKGKGGGAGQPGNGGDVDVENHPAVRALREKLAAQEAKTLEIEEAKKSAEQAAREQRLEAAIVEQLEQNGLSKARARVVLPFVRGLKTKDGKPVAVLDDNGAPTWMDQRAGYAEPLELAAGLTAYLKTEGGKHLLPPTNAGGTGDGAGQPTGDPQKPTDWNALKGALNFGAAMGQAVDI